MHHLGIYQKIHLLYPQMVFIVQFLQVLWVYAKKYTSSTLGMTKYKGRDDGKFHIYPLGAKKRYLLLQNRVR